jgi:hypothetical protein
MPHKSSPTALSMIVSAVYEFVRALIDLLNQHPGF